MVEAWQFKLMIIRLEGVLLVGEAVGYIAYITRFVTELAMRDTYGSSKLPMVLAIRMAE